MATEIGWGYPSIAKEVEQPKAEEPTVDEVVKDEPTVDEEEEAKPQQKKKK
nr:MAG TPA: hypothetical protein [Caudoviricetes sp.]